MNKSELIEAIASDSGISKSQAKLAVESFTHNVAETLAKGEKLSLVGWGTFSASVRPARDGRNPKTGDIIKIAEKKVVKFKAGASLAEKVNKNK